MLKLFKKKDPKKKTAIHPKYKKLTEKVFSIDGQDFYMFKNLLDMPHKRYNSCSRFATEFNMRIDAETLKDLLTKSLEQINEGNITRVAVMLSQLKEQTEMLISIDASYRLASCVYFFKDEDLDEYDFEIGDMKIEMFKKEKLDSFFLKMQMHNFIPRLNISDTVLEAYLRYEKQIKKLQAKALKD